VWAAILAPSLPMLVIGMCGGRLLIIARRQYLLIRLSATSVAANALLDWVFFGILGPVGIPVATVLVRTLSAVLYLIVVRRAIRGFIGSELVGSDAAEQQHQLAAPAR
jgi:Na+-driven multidrug efflux pump